MTFWRPDFRALNKLIDAATSGSLLPGEQAQLEQMLLTDQTARQHYLKRVFLIGQLHWLQNVSRASQLHLPTTASKSETSANLAKVPPLVTADAEWFIREVPLTDDPPALRLAPALGELGQADPISPWGASIAPRFVVWGLTVTLLLVLFALATSGLVIGTREPAVAKLIAEAQPHWRGPERLDLGDILPAGKLMHLEFGAIELRFPGSATVVIRGPAEFQVVDRGRLSLTFGELTAHVPPRAVGFVVESAGLAITDLGTEFAVSVSSQGRAQVTVLDGSVELAGSPDKSGAPQRLILGVGESVARESIQQPLSPIAPPTLDTLPREISAVRAPLRLNGSGVGLREGQEDPNWIITCIADDPNFVPQSAIVASDAAPYMRNDPAVSQWLSLGPDFHPVGLGMYGFEFDFDLDGVDPSTVVVYARISVDDAVRSVRLNGHDIGWQTPANLGRSAMEKYFDLTLNEGFVAGRNRLEFNVEDIEATRVGLRMAIEGSGCLISRRLGAKPSL